MKRIIMILMAAVLLLAGCSDEGQGTDSSVINTADSSSQISQEEIEAEAIKPTPVLVMEVGGKQFYPTPADNSSAEAFLEKLNAEPLKLELHDYGGFEKVGTLPWDLPRNDEQITTVPGDIILYQGDQLTIYYDENTWNFTRLAQIDSVTKEELLEVLGDGDVTVEFWLEWSE